MSKWDKYERKTSESIPVSKWDKYERKNSQLPVKSYDKYKIKPKSKWDKYAISEPTVNNYSTEPEQSNLELATKSVGSGLVGLLDLPQNVASLTMNPEYGLYGLGRRAINRFRGRPHEPLSGPTYLQSLPDNMASNAVKGALKKYANIDITPKPSTAGQRIGAHAGEFIGGVGPFGLLGKFKGAANTAKNVAKTSGMAGTLGATSGVLQEEGMDPLTADIGTSIALPALMASGPSRNILHALKNPRQTAVKAPQKLLGLGPKKLNIEAAQAARDLGIDLPAAALTESKLTGLADQFVGKVPFFGDKLANKYITAEQQTKDALERIYESVGPKKTPEIESKIARLYDIRAKTLPKDAKVKPVHLEKAIDNIKINTAILSPDEKSLLQNLETIKKEIKPESSLVGKYGKLNLPLQEYSVDKLVGAKKSLNQIIKWDTDEGIKNQLRSLQRATAQDIEAYGKTNPKWYKDFKEADDMYGKVARRENLENKLGSSINPSADNIGYANLSKRIHSPKQFELIKKQVSPEVLGKIEKLGTVARAMAVKNRGIPNPPGTAITAVILGAIPSFIHAPISTVSAVGGTAVLSKLLTDKKFVDLALKYAETPSVIKSIPVNKRIKDLTGYSAAVLSREINRESNKE